MFHACSHFLHTVNQFIMHHYKIIKSSYTLIAIGEVKLFIGIFYQIGTVQIPLHFMISNYFYPLIDGTFYAGITYMIILTGFEFISIDVFKSCTI